MDDLTEGLSLPRFSGRLSADFTAWEAQLAAYLRVVGIPQHAREASDVILLALEGQASAVFLRAPEQQRSTFANGMGLLRTQFQSLHRQRLARSAAQNALDLRGFRDKGRRRELVKDLLSEVELLFERAGIWEDYRMRQAFIRCFLEFPGALSLLGKTQSYAEAVSEAFRWETLMIKQEIEAIYEPNSFAPSTLPAFRPRPPPPRPPSPSLRPANDPLAVPLPSPPTQYHYHHAPSPQPPSTIEELVEAEGQPFYRPENTTPEGDRGASNFLTYRHSFTFPRINLANRRTNEEQSYGADPLLRSRSVDFVRASGSRRETLPDSDNSRSSSTPPFIADAMCFDGNPQTESAATGDARKHPRKLVRNDSKRREFVAGELSMGLTSTKASFVSRLFGSRRPKVLPQEAFSPPSSPATLPGEGRPAKLRAGLHLPLP